LSNIPCIVLTIQSRTCVLVKDYILYYLVWLYGSWICNQCLSPKVTSEFVLLNFTFLGNNKKCYTLNLYDIYMITGSSGIYLTRGVWLPDLKHPVHALCWQYNLVHVYWWRNIFCIIWCGCMVVGFAISAYHLKLWVLIPLIMWHT
jgi:hypothetical protein